MVLQFLPLVLAMSGQATAAAAAPPPRRACPRRRWRRRASRRRRARSTTRPPTPRRRSPPPSRRRGKRHPRPDQLGRERRRALREVHAGAAGRRRSHAAVLLGREQARHRGRRPPRQEHGRGRDVRRKAGCRRPALLHRPRRAGKVLANASATEMAARRPGHARSRRRSRVPRETPGAGARRRPAIPGRPEPGRRRDGKYVFLWFTAPW